MPIKPENKDRYPDNWKEISNYIRFERAGGRCECEGECGHVHDGMRCNAIHLKPHPITNSKVILTTGHLDHIPENCHGENLKAWCQRCHLSYDAVHHAKTAYMTRKKKANTDDMFGGL